MADDQPTTGQLPITTHLSKVFPSSKIKMALQRNEDIGSITQPALELIGAASAAFLKALVGAAVERQQSSDPSINAAEDSTGAVASQEANTCGVLRLQDLKQMVQLDERFRFLSDTLEDVSSQLNDHRPAKRPRRRARSSRKKAPNVTSEIAEVSHQFSQDTGAAPLAKEIIVDEEDYD